jgi:hypothetical protein
MVHCGWGNQKAIARLRAPWLIAGTNYLKSKEHQLFSNMLYFWLGKWFLFQTFKLLDDVKEIADANEIRQLIDYEDE